MALFQLNMNEINLKMHIIMNILKDLFAFTHGYLLTYKTLRNQNTSKMFAICFFSDVNYPSLKQIHSDSISN